MMYVEKKTTTEQFVEAAALDRGWNHQDSSSPMSMGLTQ